MRGLFLLILTMLPVGASWADAAQEVVELKAKLDKAEATLGDVRGRIEEARKQHGKADAELRKSVQRLAGMGQYPDGFWLARSLMMDSPGQVETIKAMARMQRAAIVRSQAEMGKLTQLYGEANRNLQDLRDIEDAYGEAHGRLLAVERKVLQRAGMQADALGVNLEAALAGSSTLTFEPLEIKQVVAEGSKSGLPVAGRVERSFGQGDGAAKAGVVLRAKTGVPVQALQAARVLYAGPFRHFGGLVIVKTVRGEDVLLGGMGTLHVKAGDDVVGGQVIGTVGETGRIYWEVRRNGRPVNPL